MPELNETIRIERSFRRVRPNVRDGYPFPFYYSYEDAPDVDYSWFISTRQMDGSPELQRILSNWVFPIVRDNDGDFIIGMSHEEYNVCGDLNDNMIEGDVQAFITMYDNLHNHAIIEDVELTLESRDDFFPVRYGVELEYETNERMDMAWTKRQLITEGLDVQSVKYDGSLMTSGGFEIVSNPLDSTRDLLRFMVKSKRKLDSLDMPIMASSPSAVHIHVSNLKKPTNLFLVMYGIAPVLDKMRKIHKNELVHERLTLPNKSDLIGVLGGLPNDYSRISASTKRLAIRSKICPLYSYECSQIYNYFMHGRRSTLRYSGYDSSRMTLEFRIMPQRLHTSVYKSYVKMTQKLIEYAESLTFDEAYSFASTMGNSTLDYQSKKFMEICDLNKKEMFGLFNGIKGDRTVLYDELDIYEICHYKEPVTEIKYFRCFFANYYSYNLDKYYKTNDFNNIINLGEELANSLKSTSESISNMSQFYNELQLQPFHYYYGVDSQTSVDSSRFNLGRVGSGNLVVNEADANEFLRSIESDAEEEDNIPSMSNWLIDNVTAVRRSEDDVINIKADIIRPSHTQRRMIDILLEYNQLINVEEHIAVGGATFIRVEFDVPTADFYEGGGLQNANRCTGNLLRSAFSAFDSVGSHNSEPIRLH